ncbi:MAG: HNH endonuclease, partial [Nitrospirae bacterium]|nr:HNH endonuclease [Nitrospirota bacterium]
METVIRGPISPGQYGLKVKTFPKNILRIMTNIKGDYIAEVEKKNSANGTLVALHKIVICAHLNLPLETFKQKKLLDIHHIDEDRANNHIRNLLLISRHDHEVINSSFQLNRRGLTRFI